LSSGRPFPHSLEYERALLGGLIRNPGQLREIAEQVGADDFYNPGHEALFTLLLQMDAQGEPIEMVTVPERIQRDGKPDRYGGLAYVVQLPDHVPATANLSHYAQVIRQKSVLRRLISHSQELVTQAFEQPDDVGLLLERASQNIFTLGHDNGKRSWQRISLIIDEELLRIQELGNQDASITGVTTGFSDLDKKLSGLQRGDLVILAARPSMGKTALALNMAQNAALMGDVAVGIFSLEMSRQQLTVRMLCTHGMVDAGKMRTGKLDADDWERLIEASDYLRRASIHIDDTPGITLRELRARARRLKQQDPKLGLIVIDYLQLMQADDPSVSRTQQVSDISRGLKALAKDLEVPVMALSQLSRNVESRADKRPMMSDLRESGAIEQDADVILFIYRDEYYNKESADKGLAEVIVAKQRSGPTGEIKLVFQGQYTRFDDLASRDSDDL
jgi:replicative DNA helicase